MTGPLLAIDTAAPRLQLALLAAGRVNVLVDDMPKGQAEALFPAIAVLLERNGVAYRDLRRVASTTGPGSFTGLRIGLSAARGLGVALDVPVLGIPSLLALSLSAPDGPVDVLVDARRDEAYFQTFSGPGEPKGEPRLLPSSEAVSLLRPEATRIAGPFVDIAAVARFAAAADPERWPPHAAYIRGADAKPQDKARIARIPA